MERVWNTVRKDMPELKKHLEFWLVYEMNQKEFMQQIDKILNRMDKEDLKNCLHNIARKTSESKRDSFLQMIKDFCDHDKQKDINDKYQHKRLMSDKKVKEKLTDIKKAFEEIEDGELCLSAQGYEDYSNGYWASDWIWEYEDNEGIGRIIEDAVLFAHDCMNDCRYEEAATIFKLVMDTTVFAEDEFGGDSFELNLEEMVDEKLVGVNLKVLALDVLYSNYQLQPGAQRASILYSYFSYPYFKEIHIEDIFSIGREELRDTEKFLQSWIDFLMEQSGDIAARLLREALLYHKGTEGLVEMARKGYKEHPSVYLAALKEYEKNHDYEKMKEIGIEALDKLESDLKIRSEIAIKTAQASRCVNDTANMRKCWYEAFYSNSTIPNFLRLFVDQEVVNGYKVFSEKRIETLNVCEYHSNHHISETSRNEITELEYKYLCFFSGHFDKVYNWCKEQKQPLGWTGNFIGRGIDLMLLYLYEDINLRKAVKKIATQISNWIGFDECKNLLFFKENYVFENDLSNQKSIEIFWDVFSLWKLNYLISATDINVYVEWLESVISKRVDGIVGGKYRSRYNDVALLVAALGEVKESLGIKMAKSTLVNQYMCKYPRHRSFRGELKEYMD